MTDLYPLTGKGPVDFDIEETTDPCEIHNQHIPISHVNERHHVWPLAEGGPDTIANVIVLCPTGHVNVHELLRMFVKWRGEVPYTDIRSFAFGERKVAKLGWERMQRGAL